MNVFIAILLAGILGNYIFWVFKLNSIDNGYAVGDWLINFSAGFVRRGLPGELAKAAAAVTGLGLARIVLLSQILLCISFVTLFWMLIRDKEKPFWFLLFVFSPATLLFTVIDSSSVGRKEILLYVFLAVYLNVLTRKVSLQNHPVFIFICVVISAVVTLCHELFFFFTPYFFAGEWLAGKRAKSRRLVSSSFIFFGSLAALLAIVTFGARIDGQAICKNLLGYGLTGAVCLGELSYEQGLAANMARILGLILKQDYLATYGAAFLFGSMPLIVGYLQRKKAELAPEKLGAFLVASVIFSAPLYLFATAWGRWVSITFTCTLLLATFFLDARDGSDGDNAGARHSRTKQLLLCCFFLLNTFCWGIPESLSGHLNTGLIGKCRKLEVAIFSKEIPDGAHPFAVDVIRRIPFVRNLHPHSPK